MTIEAPVLSCGYCGHPHTEHTGSLRCSLCSDCDRFRQPPIVDPDEDTPDPVTTSLFGGFRDLLREGGLSMDSPSMRVALHTSPPDIDRTVVETISRNMMDAIDARAMEALAHPRQIVRSTTENRIPLVLRSTRPLPEGEGQRLADLVRSQTTYPVVVVDHFWEVVS